MTSINWNDTDDYMTQWAETEDPRVLAVITRDEDAEKPNEWCGCAPYVTLNDDYDYGQPGCGFKGCSQCSASRRAVEGVFSKGMKVHKTRWVLCANEFNPGGVFVNDEDLISFTPVYARVDPYDENDKSVRKDRDGDLWAWNEDTSTWDCDEHGFSEPSLDVGAADKYRPFSFA